MKRLILLTLPLMLLAILLVSGCKKDKDTTPPEITMLGYNPYNFCVGTPYFDAGATAYDETDGDLTDKIEVRIDVDTSQESEGTVTYEVSDAAGNKATATRQVNVIFCD